MRKNEESRNWEHEARVVELGEKRWNAFSVPIVAEKIVVVVEGREWRQKEMSAIG